MPPLERLHGGGPAVSRRVPWTEMLHPIIYLTAVLRRATLFRRRFPSGAFCSQRRGPCVPLVTTPLPCRRRSLARRKVILVGTSSNGSRARRRYPRGCFLSSSCSPSLPGLIFSTRCGSTGASSVRLQAFSTSFDEAPSSPRCTRSAARCPTVRWWASSKLDTLSLTCNCGRGKGQPVPVDDQLLLP